MSTSETIVVFVDWRFMADPIGMMPRVVPWRYVTSGDGSSFNILNGEHHGTGIWTTVHIGDVIIIKDQKYILPR
jgi:hypothetical protein